MRVRNLFKPDVIRQAVITLAVAATAGIGVYVFTNKDQPQSVTDDTANAQPLVKVEPSGISYPKAWVEAEQITQSNKDAGVVSEGRRTNPDAKVIVRLTDVDIASDFDIKKLPDDLVVSLEAALDNFSLKKKMVVKLGAYDAAKIEYSDGAKFNYMMFVIPSVKKTLYITYRGIDNLTNINSEIDTINTSAAAYLKTQLKN